ncbi:hypothetical protein [Pseudonocardia xinjiangensis]|uniref:Membrane protein YesL n=1 Tax=Pseudonocardia xinjiangensis TaxID=75289 RepID=A0ABX1RBB3_9PSEU|nr:hypothetical protein [Pseudonocardia xinjiangensis]NMH77670.1 hypothetical protein [Pseudonocardia xinjiangensis]
MTGGLLRRRVPEPTGSGRGWKEQLRRVSELCLLGIVAAVLCLPLLTVGAVVAVLSSAVGHWIDHDDLPPWRDMGAELLRRLLPGAAVAVAGGAAALVVVRQVRWLASGEVPGGSVALVALLVATGCLLAVVLLAVPLLAGGGSWRSALAGGWAALLRSPGAGAAALGVTLIAATLAVLLPGAVLLLPALLVLALHAVYRALVR